MDVDTTLPFTTTQKYRIDSCTAMANKMKNHIVGPMPANQFLNDFFPTKDIPHYHRREFHAGCYDNTVKAMSELHAYEPFVNPTLD
jgi:hypothetical protein